MPSAIKERMVAELATQFRQMPHAILVDYTGLKAGKADELRARLGEQGARLRVVKNSLAALAFRQLALPAAAELLEGPTALISGGPDPVLLAKSVLDWSKKEKLLTVRGGLLGGRALDAAGVQRLASLPPVLVLRAQVAGAIAAPLTRFVGVLQGIVRSLVSVVKAIAEKQEGSSAPSA
jgi:large subunit ribosomal protein L10